MLDGSVNVEDQLTEADLELIRKFRSRLEPKHDSPPLAALELGHDNRRLRQAQQSVWCGRLTDMQDVEGWLDRIEANLRVVGKTLTAPRVRELREGIETGHTEAAAFAFGLLDPSSPGTWPERLRAAEGAPFWEGRQRRAWQELRGYVLKEVLATPCLRGWYAIGDAIADLLGRIVGETLHPLDLEDMVWDRLYRGVTDLEGEERQFADSVMPRGGQLRRPRTGANLLQTHRPLRVGTAAPNTPSPGAVTTIYTSLVEASRG
jgi:hypothetical protein